MGERTENYGLALAGAEDKMERGTVNGNWGVVDEALAGKCEVVFGSYMGNGEYPRSIELGFRPKAVLQFVYNGCTNVNGSIYGGLFSPGFPLQDGWQSYAYVTETGFILKSEFTNNGEKGYYYFAVR